MYKSYRGSSPKHKCGNKISNQLNNIYIQNEKYLQKNSNINENRQGEREKRAGSEGGREGRIKSTLSGIFLYILYFSFGMY